jgi:hypothetical protein
MELTEEQLMRRRAADKKYKDANKEKERLRHKKYNDEHKEESKTYREANKEKLKEYAKLSAAFIRSHRICSRRRSIRTMNAGMACSHPVEFWHPKSNRSSLASRSSRNAICDKIKSNITK